MKKLLGMLGASALLMLGSCANDNFDGPQNPGEQTKGDLYLSMVISQKKSTDTRTQTGQQGAEIGKDRENKISSALVVFANEGKVVYTTTIGANDITGATSPYNATFAVDRSKLLSDIKGGTDGTGTSKTYQIYVIANPGSISYSVNDDVQKVFSLDADDDTYWGDNAFLMSNATLTSKEIVAEEIKVGTHTTATEAYPLGSVTLQRAMSRFDIYTDDDHIKFTIQNGAKDEEGDAEDVSKDQNDVNVVIDGVALVNQATSAYLFKATSLRKGNVGEEEMVDEEYQLGQWNTFKSATNKLLFGVESKYNYVFSPIQSAFTLPLFGSNRATASATNGKLIETSYDYSTLTFTPISTIKDNEEDNTYTYPNDTKPDNEGTYHIWRYCMENTNFGIGDNDQVHGNSTGLVFRAIMTGSKFKGKDVYSFNSVILGDIDELKAYATNNKSDKDDSGVYELVKIAYADAVQKAINANKSTDNEGGWKNPNGWKIGSDGNIIEPTAGIGETLNEYLVKNSHFTVFRPTMTGESKNIPVYYCYYTYWNRHNDNGLNTIMGQMEFATVRNNVYKILVNTVVRLGHPGNPDDDPDPDDPGTPDEKDSFYCSIICKVLPWEVRMNSLDL